MPTFRDTTSVHWSRLVTGCAHVASASALGEQLHRARTGPRLHAQAGTTLTEVTAFICDAATPDRVADHLIAASTPPPRPSVSGCVFLVIKYSRVRLLNPP